MEIIALQQYTDKHISLYEGEIRNITDYSLAAELIEKGIIAEHSDSSSGGGGGDSEEETPLFEIALTEEFLNNNENFQEQKTDSVPPFVVGPNIVIKNITDASFLDNSYIKVTGQPAYPVYFEYPFNEYLKAFTYLHKQDNYYTSKLMIGTFVSNSNYTQLTLIAQNIYSNGPIFIGISRSDQELHLGFPTEFASNVQQLKSNLAPFKGMTIGFYPIN